MENKPKNQFNKNDFYYHRFNSTKVMPNSNFNNIHNKKKNDISNIKNENSNKQPKLNNEINGDINNKKSNEINFNIKDNIIINDEENHKKSQEEIKMLKLENEELKKYLEKRGKLILDLTERCNEQKKMISELMKKIDNIKEFIPESAYKKDRHKINDKLEEKLAIAAVEEQIIKEICSDSKNQVSIEKIFKEENNRDENNKIKNKIQIIPQIYYKRNQYENTSCSICIDEFKDNELLKQLKCGHIFHQECLSQWLINMDICPYCNKKC